MWTAVRGVAVRGGAGGVGRGYAAGAAVFKTKTAINIQAITTTGHNYIVMWQRQLSPNWVEAVWTQPRPCSWRIAPPAAVPRRLRRRGTEGWQRLPEAPKPRGEEYRVLGFDSVRQVVEAAAHDNHS